MFLCEEISTSQCTLEVGSTRLSNDETRRRKNRFPPATIFLRSATPAGDRQRRAGNVKVKGSEPLRATSTGRTSADGRSRGTADEGGHSQRTRRRPGEPLRRIHEPVRKWLSPNEAALCSCAAGCPGLGANLGYVRGRQLAWNRSSAASSLISAFPDAGHWRRDPTPAPVRFFWFIRT